MLAEDTLRLAAGRAPPAVLLPFGSDGVLGPKLEEAVFRPNLEESDLGPKVDEPGLETPRLEELWFPIVDGLRTGCLCPPGLESALEPKDEDPDFRIPEVP